MASFKFVKYKNNKGSYAVIDFELMNCDSFTINWSPELIFFSELYQKSVEAGVLKVLTWINKTKICLNVIAFEELITDTSENDVECAAIMAAWLTIGRKEDELEIKFVDDKWTIEFKK